MGMHAKKVAVNAGLARTVMGIAGRPDRDANRRVVIEASRGSD